MTFKSAGVLALVLYIASCASYAQDSIEIPCKDARPAAVLTLPAPLNEWGQIYCTIYGHTLAAKDGWLWSYPGAFAPVHLPAQMLRNDPKKIGHDAYFKSITLTKLSESDKSAAEEKLDGILGTEHVSTIGSAYRLVLTNNEGGSHTVIFVLTEAQSREGGFWGLWCAPEGCDKGSPFMLLNYEKRP